MSDLRDDFNSFEKDVIGKSGKHIVVNKYLPDGVEYSTPKEEDFYNIAGQANLNNKNTDNTITKKEKKVRMVIGVIIVIIVVGTLWLLSTKNKKSGSIKSDKSGIDVVTQATQKIFSNFDIEGTIAPNTMTKPSQTNSQNPSQQNVSIGDHVSYKTGDENSLNPFDAKRNYNTPLFIKYDPNGFNTTRGIRAPLLPVPKSSYVRVYLEREIGSGNLDMPVTAMSYVDMTYNGRILIPSGSKFVGKTDYSGGNRIMLVFNYVIFPGGKEYSIKGSSLGDDNVAGVPGQMNYKLAKKGSSVIASSLLNATASSLTMTGDSFGSIFAGNMAGNTADSVDGAIDYSGRNNAMAITVPMNSRFKIIF
ncbi:hypothetical protein KJ708_00915 [bacterium]|nr:hypothetical protein [bacterium]